MQPLNTSAITYRSNNHRPALFNALLWSFTFVILLFVFSKGTTPITADYIYTCMFLIALAIPVCLNFYILIPKLLQRENYFAYGLCFIINLLVCAWLTSWFLQPVLDVLFPNYFFISYLSKNHIFAVFTIVLCVTTLLKFTEDWFYFNTHENKILRLKNLQVETQLSTLKAQINPHFLFNSLNVIYALALEKQDDTTKAIVQLSDILRYVIYDSNSPHVPLKDEITLLKNYIAFQNHRMGADLPCVFDIDIKDPSFTIYPMLLLPLLENSYKHGLRVEDQNATIKMTLFQNADYFRFSISNSKSHITSTLNDKYSGVGLDNLKNNLNLVYPHRHELTIDDTPQNFNVILTLYNDI